MLEARSGLLVRLPTWALALALGGLYAALARLSLGLSIAPIPLAVVWLPSGLLFAALVLAPHPKWPWLLGACWAAILPIHLATGQTLGAGLSLAMLNVSAPALAAALFRWLAPPPYALTRLRQVGALLLVVLGSSSLTTLLGATLMTLFFSAPFDTIWLRWWIADALGMLLVGSSILVWAYAPDEYARPGAWSLVEAGLAFGLMSGVALFTFGMLPAQVVSPSPYLIFPVILWVATRFGPRGTAPLALLLALIAVWCTTIGRGPFVAFVPDPLIRLREVQLFLFVEAVSALALAALTAERRHAQRELHAANAQLEARVTERTSALAAANLRLLSESNQRAQAVSALQASQAQVRQAMHLARMFAFSWDRHTDVLTRSPYAAAILGLSEAEALADTSTNCFQRVHPDDRDRLIAVVHQRSPAEPSYRQIYRIIRPDGTTVIIEEVASAHFDADGRYISLTGICADVTERQQATIRTERLHRATVALATALTPVEIAQVIVAQGVAALDATAGVIVVRNDLADEVQMLAAAGYAAPSIESWQCFSLDAPVPIAEAVRYGKPIWISGRDALLARYPALANTSVYNRSFAAIPLIVGGRVIGALGLSFAQTEFDAAVPSYAETLAELCAQALERARLFAEMEAARATAEEAVGLRDRFLSIASHELKAPLTVLIGNATLIQRRAQRNGDLDQRYLRGLTTVADQAVRLDRLINTLLDSSRIERGQLSLDLVELDLRTVLQRVAHELHPTLTRHRLAVDLVSYPAIIQGDELRLIQLWQNLLYNAVKYSPAGGPILVSLVIEERCAVTRITDGGIGIPPAELPQLFGRFFRASNTNRYHISGMGIGLFVSREIVTRHGGTIDVANNPEGGTTFTVSLPLANAQTSGSSST